MCTLGSAHKFDGSALNARKMHQNVVHKNENGKTIPNDVRI